MNKIYYVIGVSGSGKSTIGQQLAETLQLPFFDADDFHPEANLQKMKNGFPLNDEDRQPWLESLARQAQEAVKVKGAVITCSALKEKYRKTLEQNIASQVHWIFLDGSLELIHDRMKKRTDHFMPIALLKSQFDALEKPENALTISILAPPEKIIQQIIDHTKMNQLSEFGVIGLGVMGKSLALNLAEKGFRLSLYNRHEAGVEERIAEKLIESDPLLHAAKGFDDLEAFVASMAAPRKILIMIKAGPALDKVIDIVIPILSEGDILIDGGNSHYTDTKRRMDYLESKNMHFIGSGVSGGEEGARRGPSIMPGGSEKAYAHISQYLEAIAAKDQSGNACCTFIGVEGAGHFIKMVHNGVEYAEMQLIAEAYGLLRFGAGHTPNQIAAIFESWMDQGLGSYLLEISIAILKTKEEDHWLIDKILDKAGNKGTGSWTTIAAAELGIPVTMITAALFARYTSSFKTERVENSKAYQLQNGLTATSIDTEVLKNAYQIARIINHHQGFLLMDAAAAAYEWNLNFSEIARIWTNGCIIRSELMEQLVEPLKEKTQIMTMEAFVPIITQHKGALGDVLKLGIDTAQETPCFSAAFNYLIAHTTAQSTANIIQAQRDYFGAHTYLRNDDESGEAHHTEW